MSPLFEPTTAGAHTPTRHVMFARAIRRTLGVLNVAASITIVVALSMQITEKVVNDVFRPTEYFAFFTIQSSIINVVVLVMGGVLSLKRGTDPRWYTATRACIVAYAIITGIVYNLLLRDVQPRDGFITEFPHLSDIVHVYIPLFIALEWILMPGRSRLSWSILGVICAYPAAWTVATLIRGAADGWYPYPFLEPTGPAGLNGVIAYVLAIAACLVTVGALAVAVERAHSQLFQKLGLDRTAL